jgi:hypothetical protein
VEGALTGKYQFGVVVNNQNAQQPPTDWYTDQSFAVDEPVLVVGNYVFNGALGDDDIVNLWINPVPGEAAPTPSVTSAEGIDVQLGGFSVIRTFWFRSDGQFPGDLIVDELRIGQTFADVTPAGATVIDGDFNDDGFVDAADYVAWRKNTPGIYTEDNYNDFVRDFGTAIGEGGSGSVPEPSTLVALALCAITMLPCRARR